MAEAEFTVDAAYLRDILQAIPSDIDEFALSAADEGLLISAMTADRTTLVQALLPRSFFESFTLDDEVALSVQVGPLRQVLRLLRRDDTVALELSASHLRLTAFDDSDSSRPRRSFEISADSAPPVSLRDLKVDYTSGARLDPRAWALALKVAKLVHDVEVAASEERLTLEGAAADPLSRAYATIRRVDMATIDMWGPEASTVVAAGRLLATAPGKKVSEVRIEVAQDQPLKVQHELGGLGDARLLFYIANLGVR